MSFHNLSSSHGRLSKDSSYNSTYNSIYSHTYSTTPSSGSLGLPGDEFRILQKRQNRDRLDAHFSHYASPSYSHHPRPVCRDMPSTQDARLLISEVKNATRQALGRNFDFTDDWHDRTKRHESVETRGDAKEYGEPIPQKYLDEYHKWSREDDAKYDADQSMADYTPGARWRAHDHLHIDVTAMRPSTSHRETFRHLPQPVHASIVPNEPDYARPVLVSKFSFDSDMPPRRSFFRRR